MIKEEEVAEGEEARGEEREECLIEREAKVGRVREEGGVEE